MRYARIYPWRRTRRSRAPSNGPDAFFVAQFSAGYTTNMFVFDLRQGQVPMVTDLLTKVEKYETKAARCEESARQATDEPERAFYQELANYYGAVATDFRQVIEKRKAA